MEIGEAMSTADPHFPVPFPGLAGLAHGPELGVGSPERQDH